MVRVILKDQTGAETPFEFAVPPIPGQTVERKLEGYTDYHAVVHSVTHREDPASREFEYVVSYSWTATPIPTGEVYHAIDKTRPGTIVEEPPPEASRTPPYR